MKTAVKTVRLEDGTVINYSNAAMKIIFEKIVQFAIKHNTFDSEVAGQDDEFLINSPWLLSEILDDIGFDVVYE